MKYRHSNFKNTGGHLKLWKEKLLNNTIDDQQNEKQQCTKVRLRNCGLECQSKLSDGKHTLAMPVFVYKHTEFH